LLAVAVEVTPMTNLMSERARGMRRQKGAAERKLWYRLREFNRRGFQFRQQAPIGPYIADFCEHSAKLIVEVDGSQHGEPKGVANDKRRTRWLESQGYQVLRFWNYEVLTNIGGVEVAIMVALGLLSESGIDSSYDLQDPDSPMERLRGKVRQFARLRRPRSARRSKQDERRSVPSPLVGEGQGGGEPPTPKVGVLPTPSPSPQGGGESAHGELRGSEVHNG
jgi:very-short-patch-repair endonuclease